MPLAATAESPGASEGRCGTVRAPDGHPKLCGDQPRATAVPLIDTGIPRLALLPGFPDDDEFIRLYPTRSRRLRDSLDLVASDVRWVFMDVPHQLSNIAELGLIAADYLILLLSVCAGVVVAVYQERRRG